MIVFQLRNPPSDDPAGINTPTLSHALINVTDQTWLHHCLPFVIIPERYWGLARC